MNGDFSKLTPEERDARLTALALGELRPNEAAELHRALAADPALARAFALRQKTIGLVQETITGEAGIPAGAPTRLTAERREKLLEMFAARPSERAAATGNWRKAWYVPISAAAALIGLLVAAVFILGGSRTRYGAVAKISIERDAPDAEGIKHHSYIGRHGEMETKGVTPLPGIAAASSELATDEAIEKRERGESTAKMPPAPASGRLEGRLQDTSPEKATVTSEAVQSANIVPTPPPAASTLGKGLASAPIKDGSDAITVVSGGAMMPAAANGGVYSVNAVGSVNTYTPTGVVTTPGEIPLFADNVGAIAVANYLTAGVPSQSTQFRAQFDSPIEKKGDLSLAANIDSFAPAYSFALTPQNSGEANGRGRGGEPQLAQEESRRLDDKRAPAGTAEVEQKLVPAPAPPPVVADPNAVTLSFGTSSPTNATVGGRAAFAINNPQGQPGVDIALGPEAEKRGFGFWAFNAPNQNEDVRRRSSLDDYSGIALAGTDADKAKLPQLDNKEQRDRGLGGRFISGYSLNSIVSDRGEAPDERSGATGRATDQNSINRFSRTENEDIGGPADLSRSTVPADGRRAVGGGGFGGGGFGTRLGAEVEHAKQAGENAPIAAARDRESKRAVSDSPRTIAELTERDESFQNLARLETGVEVGARLRKNSNREPLSAPRPAAPAEKPQEAGRPGVPEAAKSTPAIPPAVPQPEVLTADNPYSTFSLNVADVSFKLASASLERGAMPDAASIRSEEFINAFDYRDPLPAPGVPVAFAFDRAHYPFAHNRDILRLSIKTAAEGRDASRPLNIVLLLDNSGSMERADRVCIIQESLRTLAAQLQPRDKLSVVTFARTARLWVDGVSGTNAADVARRVGSLTPEGGTNLEDALDLAYRTAVRHYEAGSVNRVVLLTDGAANLGNVDPQALKAKVESNRKQGIALDCFGIGWEGYNDDLLETLSRNGDGRYGFVNTPEEAGTEFAAQLAGALHVAASDVKVQVEFNSQRVTAYRQIGYARHQLTKQQFRDNTVDAAEIAAAEAGNALYTIETTALGHGPIATVRVRFKVPGTADYQEHEWDVPYVLTAPDLEQAAPALRLAATASAFSEWLASSPFASDVTSDRLLALMNGVPEAFGADPGPKRLEWMIRQAKTISGK